MRKAAIGCSAALALVLLVVIGFGFLGSKAWQIERSTEVGAPMNLVHARIADLRQWPAWSTWIKDANPSGKFEFAGEPGVGMTASWTSERGLACTLTITRSDPPSGVDYELAIADFPSTARGTFAYSLTEDGRTRLVWTTSGERSDLLGGFFALLTEPLLGRKYQEDIARLRAQAEAANPTSR